MCFGGASPFVNGFLFLMTHRAVRCMWSLIVRLLELLEYTVCVCVAMCTGSFFGVCVCECVHVHSPEMCSCQI